MTTPSIQGQASVERLIHFRCDACNRWWSIGDAPPEKTTWFCPWCGQKQEMKTINSQQLAQEQPNPKSKIANPNRRFP